MILYNLFNYFKLNNPLKEKTLLQFRQIIFRNQKSLKNLNHNLEFIQKKMT